MALNEPIIRLHRYSYMQLIFSILTLISSVESGDICERTAISDAHWFQYINHSIDQMLSKDLFSIKSSLDRLQREVTLHKKSCALQRNDELRIGTTWMNPCGKIYFNSLSYNEKHNIRVNSAFGINITYHLFDLGGDAPDCVEYSVFVVALLDIYNQHCNTPTRYCGKYSKPWSKYFLHYHLQLYVYSHYIWMHYHVALTYEIVNSLWFEEVQPKFIYVEHRLRMGHLINILPLYRFGQLPKSE